MADHAHFDQSQTSVKVRRGESFAIELPSAPTTGYAWQLAGATSHVKLNDESFAASGEQMGGGGTQKFQFRALEPGVDQLKFEYGRPWRSAAEKTHKVRVTVVD